MNAHDAFVDEALVVLGWFCHSAIKDWFIRGWPVVL